MSGFEYTTSQTFLLRSYDKSASCQAQPPEVMRGVKFVVPDEATSDPFFSPVPDCAISPKSVEALDHCNLENNALAVSVRDVIARFSLGLCCKSMTYASVHILIGYYSTSVNCKA